MVAEEKLAEIKGKMGQSSKAIVFNQSQDGESNH